MGQYSLHEDDNTAIPWGELNKLAPQASAKWEDIILFGDPDRDGGAALKVLN